MKGSVEPNYPVKLCLDVTCVVNGDANSHTFASTINVMLKLTLTQTQTLTHTSRVNKPLQYSWCVFHPREMEVSSGAKRTVFLVFRYVDSQEIKRSADFEIRYEEGICTLIIKDVLPEDEGEYSVKAINDAGTCVTTAYLTVLRKYYVLFICTVSVSVTVKVFVTAGSCLCGLVVMMFALNARDWDLIPCWGTEFFSPSEPTVTFGTQLQHSLTCLFGQAWGHVSPEGVNVMAISCHDGLMVLMLTQNVWDWGLIPCLGTEFFCWNPLLHFNIMSMATDHLMDRMGSTPTLCFKRSITISTMINFNGEGHRDGTCEQNFTLVSSF